MTDKQIIGNIGLYYVCYKLSWMGWNVMPTARNARGIDIVAYKTVDNFVSIQVKTLSKNAGVGLGKSLDRVVGDYWVIVSNVASENGLRTSVMLPEEVRNNATRNKGGEKLYWLGHKTYEKPEFAEKWDRIQIKNPRR
ncbi:MAG: conserved hypothetical protein [Arenicellales bacterium IbO2]|nr:hypothetical protein [Gammaproteobacteria bacterium]CAJ2376115.1 MAG: conserved hypothetical protein [Arenicellales bacterium IbO2]